MEQKFIAKSLKIFSVLSFFIGSLFLFWYVPMVIHQVAIEYSKLSYLQIPGIVCCFVVALLCYAALYYFWKICCQIEIGNSFTMNNAKYMKYIGLIALIIFLLGIIGAITISVIGYMSGPLLVVGFFVEFVLSGITVICLALSALIKNAAIIKEENDLTI